MTPPRWDLTPAEAIAVQKELASLVQTTDDGFSLDNIRTVAGIDVSVREGDGQAAVVVLSYPDLAMVARVTHAAPIVFPYVPSLLSFRETPLILGALEKLPIQPDAIIVDGQGLAHPRRFGIACHLGILTGIPSVGVAKSVLVGRMENPLGDEPGAQEPLIHRKEMVGMALRAKLRTNPLIISVGHKMSLETAVTLVKSCLRGYRLPEPTRQAHNFAKLGPPIISDPTAP